MALWALAWAGATVLDHHVDLANQAMLFVIASVLASIWLSAPAAFAFALACMLSFDWGFVPPRGSLTVDLQRHTVLLSAMLVVSWLIAGPMLPVVSTARRTRAERGRPEMGARYTWTAWCAESWYGTGSQRPESSAM